MNSCVTMKFFAGICAALVIAVILSCSPDENGGTGPDVDPFDVKDSFSITCLFPVRDSLIKIDSISNSGIRISWKSVADAKEYSISVYDSSDTARPDHIIVADTNHCTIKRYALNQTYYVRVFSVRDALGFKCVPMYRNCDTLFVPNNTGGTDTLFDTIVFCKDTIPVGDYTKFDNVMQNNLPCDVFYKKNFHDKVLIDSSIVIKKRLVFLKNYKPEFKVKFPVYHSPNIVKFIRNGDSVSITWNRVLGEYVSGYRIYCRGYNGTIQDSVDLDTTDTSATISGNIAYATNKLKGTFKNVLSNSAYKINMTTVSKIGPGTIDSSFFIDTSSSGYNTFKLPYFYYSTFQQPDSIKDTTMTSIKGGLYVMGETWGDEDQSFCPGAKPAHEVLVSPYYLSRYEVTVSRYADFLNAIDTGDTTIFAFTGHTIKYRGVSLADTSKETWFISYVNDSFAVDAGKGNYPVLCLYWHGAAAYCNWLSTNVQLLGLDITALDTCYDSLWRCNFSKNGYRLPTEAEYEYAASGAFTGIKQRFPWGYAWDLTKAAAGGKAVEPVASYSAYDSLFDLIGNAMEYVNDWSDYLTGLYLDSSQYYVSCKQQGVVKDPAGPQYRGINMHMMRGGSFASFKNECVVYSRTIYPPVKRIAEYGFRVARGVK